ncbi:MAG: isoprenylcysteine carboxylmethyltransferase family protein [Flavobacteriaceae bacterium]|nr:isoprenylcysteine carboxylmethyltransferase family protein [Flavobacteriaceae bacterium]
MLQYSLEKTGNKLFKYRGQIPVVLFILAIPFIWTTSYIDMSDATIGSLTIASIIVSLIGFYIRFFAIATTPRGTSGRNTSKQVAESLNTKGIYSIVRHPLYLGNYFIWLGIVVFTFSWSFMLIFSLAYWIYYERIMYAEEQFLHKKFGDKYKNWSSKTPAFWPSFKHSAKGDVPFSMKAILRREYSGVLATVMGFVYVEALRQYSQDMLSMDTMRIPLYILGGTAVVTLILRTLKKTTRVLHDDVRD